MNEHFEGNCPTCGQHCRCPACLAHRPGRATTKWTGPDAYLQEILTLVADIGADEVWLTEDVDRLLDLIIGLDQWLSSRGELPQRWQQRRHHA